MEIGKWRISIDADAVKRHAAAGEEIKEELHRTEMPSKR